MNLWDDNALDKTVGVLAKKIKGTKIFKAIVEGDEKINGAKDKLNKKKDQLKEKAEKTVDKGLDKVAKRKQKADDKDTKKSAKLKAKAESREAKKKAAAEKRKQKAEEKRKKDEEKKKKRLEKDRQKQLKKEAKKKAKEEKLAKKKAEKLKKKEDKDKLKKENKKKKDESRKMKKEGKKAKLDDKERKKHAKYVKEISKKLSKKSKKQKTFEEFYAMKKAQGEKVEADYQGKVVKGIDVRVTINKYAEAKQSSKVNFDILITKNDAKDKAEEEFGEGGEKVSNIWKTEIDKMHPDSKKYTISKLDAKETLSETKTLKSWGAVREWLEKLKGFINILGNVSSVSKINISPVKNAARTVLTEKVKGNTEHEKNSSKYQEELYNRTQVHVNKVQADTPYSSLREALLNHAFENKDPTAIAEATYRDKSNNDISHLLEDKSELTREIDEYQMNVKFSKAGGSAHHFGQDAAYRDHVPSEQAVSIVLYGNAFKDKGSEHYIAHMEMEKFWDQFRKKGDRYGDIPKNSEVLDAMYNALLTAGIDEKTAREARNKTAIQQNEYGLTLDMDVPRIPDKINQAK